MLNLEASTCQFAEHFFLLVNLDAILVAEILRTVKLHAKFVRNLLNRTVSHSHQGTTEADVA